jgi:hypothetical protein
MEARVCLFLDLEVDRWCEHGAWDCVDFRDSRRGDSGLGGFVVVGGCRGPFSAGVGLVDRVVLGVGVGVRGAAGLGSACSNRPSCGTYVRAPMLMIPVGSSVGLLSAVSSEAIVQAFSKSTVDPANRVEQRTRTLRKQRNDTRQHKKPSAPSRQAEKPLHSAPAEHLIEACPSPPPQLALGLPQLRW